MSYDEQEMTKRAYSQSAFPRPITDTDYGAEGMTLRDWFAGHVVAGMLAHSTRYKPRPGASADWHEAISEEAYQIADAMMDAKTK